VLDRVKRKVDVEVGPVKVSRRRAVEAQSDRFRATVEEGNIDQAGELFHEQATFRSPVLFKPTRAASR
jgi:hypothetical protein